MPKAIEIQGLSKIFPKTNRVHYLPPFSNRQVVVALDKISLEIEEGKVFGILGPNGAGKTTLIKILSTSVTPTEGTATVHGLDVVKEAQKVKRLIGLVNSEERSFFWRLTGRQNLRFFSSLYGFRKPEIDRKIDEMLELFDLQDQADVRFHHYSTGMRQKLAIARGLINRPKIIFMDEPTRSVDPLSARALRDFIREQIVKAYHCTLILTTHNLSEAEELCEHIAIIHKGRIIAQGSADELRNVYSKKHVFRVEVENLSDSLLKKLSGIPECTLLPTANRKVDIEIIGSSNTYLFHDILKQIIENNGKIIHCTSKEAPFEEVFKSIITQSETSLSEGSLIS